MDPIDAPSGVVVSLGSFTLWIGVCRPRRGFSVRQTATPKLTTRSLIWLWKSSSVAKQSTVAVHFDQPAAGAEIGAGKPHFLKRKCTPNRQTFPILPDRRLKEHVQVCIEIFREHGLFSRNGFC